MQGQQRPDWRIGRDPEDDEDDEEDEARRYDSRSPGQSEPRSDGDRPGDRDATARQEQGRDGATGMRPPASMGTGGAFCGPLGGRFAGARLARMERAIQPTEAQRSAFEKLREAMTQAQEKISASCTQERPLTPTARLAALEKRLEASLDAVKTVRPALDALYASLTDEQKAWLQMMAPRRGFRHRAYQDRDDARAPYRERNSSGADDFDPRRSYERNSRGDEGRPMDNDSDRRSWRREPDRDRREGERRPMRRDYDRDGWADHWRGPS